MNNTLYYKLIRDKMPEIMLAKRQEATVRILDAKSYNKALNEKLHEELLEYENGESVEELADLYEVIRAILKHKGVSMRQFERIRKEKLERNGGFEKRIFLIEVKESD
jgi:predicted house-cleaning noncanonical NTP pyrophosphatase (MazG superfamily)